jgi:hypothetical protein
METNAYELERKRTIERNRAKLKELGLWRGPTDPEYAQSGAPKAKPRTKPQVRPAPLPDNISKSKYCR